MVAVPYQAKVIYMGRERVMALKQKPGVRLAAAGAPGNRREVRAARFRRAGNIFAPPDLAAAANIAS
jgi:hypothetical protein